jgi:hypothetical protein
MHALFEIYPAQLIKTEKSTGKIKLMDIEFVDHIDYINNVFEIK